MFLLQFIRLVWSIWLFNDKIFIAKLNAYGFDSQVSIRKFISVYLNFRKQKPKAGATFSDYLNFLLVFCKDL